MPLEGLEVGGAWRFPLPPRGGWDQGGSVFLGRSWYHCCPPASSLAPASYGRPWAAPDRLQRRAQVSVGPWHVRQLVCAPQMHTPDIGGQGTTSEAIQDIIRHIRIINGRAVDA